MTSLDLGKNLVDMFERTVSRNGDLPFLWAKHGGAWTAWTWRRVADECGKLARCLGQLGVARGERVAIVAESRPEWCVTDLAVMAAGGISVPSYTTYTEDDFAYLLNHSGARVVVCSGGSVAKRLVPAIRETPSVQCVILMDEAPSDGLGVSALGWADALALGESSPPVAPADSIAPDEVACLIYTSGTGGRPKAVMLSHANIMANLRGAWRLLEAIGIGDEVFLSFLPLSHSYEHTGGLLLPIALGAQIYYAEGVESLSKNLVEARPTILTCVPRLFEVLRHRIQSGVEREGGTKARLFGLALDLGKRRYEHGGRLPLPLALVDRALDRLVRQKVRERFGGRIKAMISGGAPLSPEVGLFFTALGLPVLQGYGQTEASPVISVNPPRRCKLDTVGKPLEEVQVRIGEDGEILVAGPLVMKGYWKDPEATAQTVRDGWLHTGDIGEFDQEGYLKITDRKKDLIVNSGGDNIAPQRVEGVLLLQPEIAQALVYGDRKPHLVGLVVPHQDVVKDVARKLGVTADLARLSEHPLLQERIAAAVKRANAQLSTIERVRRFHVLSEPFTVENGLMTPTMKLRRGMIYQQFRDLLEGLYAPAK